MIKNVKLTLAALFNLMVWSATAIFGVALALMAGHAIATGGFVLWHWVHL